MKFEQLQSEWKKEMATVSALDGLSIEDLASQARKIGIRSRAVMLACTGFGVLVLFFAGLFWSVSAAPPSVSLMLVSLGPAAVSLVFAFRHFLAGRESEEFNWTLASRIRSEKKRVARQVALIARVPTHLVLPVFVLTLAGTIAAYMKASGSAANVFRPLALQAVLLVLVAGSFAVGFGHWTTKREEKQKLGPLLDKLEELEKQLEDS